MDYKQHLRERTELDVYGQNKIILFALEHYFDIDDIQHIAADAIVDKSNDKKCDLIYVDRERGIIVIGQAYIAVDDTKTEAKADKASNLNTAISWLLKKDRSSIPINLKNQSEKIVEAIEDGDIHTIELWYCHNLPESVNVDRELQKASETALSLIRDNFPENAIENVFYKEYGNKALQKLYDDANSYIIVKDNFVIDACDGFLINGKNYKSFITTVSGSWLKDQYLKYKNDLFSSNIRNYLGSIRSQKNVNHNIKQSARNNFDDFFTYNNGITAVVENLNYNAGKKKYEFSGLAVVNGAQTTGAISNSESKSLSELKVMIRFIKCNNEDLIKEIVKYNNTQNEVNVSDFRSGDPVQRRLLEEFRDDGMFDYYGARRGGETDKIKRSYKLIPSDSAAQALAAFHLDPDIAYNDKKSIWSNDKIYSKLFNQNTSAKHLILCYSLLRTIESIKSLIAEKDEQDRKQDEKATLEFLRKRGSSYMLMAGISRIFETIIDKPISDKFSIFFNSKMNIDECIDKWKPIIGITLPFIKQLDPAVDSGLKNQKLIEDSMEGFNSIFSSVSQYHSKIFLEFRKHLT